MRGRGSGRLKTQEEERLWRDEEEILRRINRRLDHTANSGKMEHRRSKRAFWEGIKPRSVRAGRSKKLKGRVKAAATELARLTFEAEHEDMLEEKTRLASERRRLDGIIEKQDRELDWLILQRREREDEARTLRTQAENERTLLSRAQIEAATLRTQVEKERTLREEAERDLTRRLQEVTDARKKERTTFKQRIQDERLELAKERGQLLEQLAQVRARVHDLEIREQASPAAPLQAHLELLQSCAVYATAERMFQSLGLDPRLQNRLHDRCYCPDCYPAHYPSVIRNDGPKAYVVPRGWVRFGLAVPIHAETSDDIWKAWCVSFHGTTHIMAKSIIKLGEFLLPMDTLPDGTVLNSANCAGRTDKRVFTSPTVNYAGLAFYAHPEHGPDDNKFQVVLQCRQKPGSFRIQQETMGFEAARTTDLCPHVKWTEIEWVSNWRKTIIPYGVLIRAFPADQPPQHFFRSPGDNGRF